MAKRMRADGCPVVELTPKKLRSYSPEVESVAGPALASTVDEKSPGSSEPVIGLLARASEMAWPLTGLSEVLVAAVNGVGEAIAAGVGVGNAPASAGGSAVELLTGVGVTGSDVLLLLGGRTGKLRNAAGPARVKASTGESSQPIGCLARLRCFGAVKPDARNANDGGRRLWRLFRLGGERAQVIVAGGCLSPWSAWRQRWSSSRRDLRASR